MIDHTRKHAATLLILLASLVAARGAASAESTDHSLLDARVQVRDAGSGLAEAIARLHAAAPDEAQWVAWIVPVVDPGQSRCCFDGQRGDAAPGVCNLEYGNRFVGHRGDTVRPVGDLRVLLRLERGGIDRVAAYTSGCSLNAGGLRVTLLEGVRPEASVRLLESSVAVDRGRRLVDEVVMAIAGHADSAADEALGRFAQRDSPRELREKAAFWSGATRGRPGLNLLRGMLRQERDRAVLERVVFGVSLSEADGAGELLLNTARKDERSDVRKHALFWLAQRAGERAIETLGEAVRDDPDAEVREHAVFALSQLPESRGIPLLIDLARTHRRAEVRQKAMFWLGQSGDPRALDLFEEILAD